MKLYQQELLIGGVLALVLVGGALYVVNRWRRANDMAWATLASVDDSVASKRYGMEPNSPDATSAAINNYRKLAQDYPHSGVAPLAFFRAGKLLHQTGKLDEALQTLDDVIKSYPKAAITPAAEEAKACVLEDKVQFAEAQALHEKVAQSGPKYMAPECYLNAARCAELTKNAPQAKEFYQKTISLAPGTSWAQFAEERLKILAQGKEAAPPPGAPAKKG
jgi:TolA-binding protein